MAKTPAQLGMVTPTGTDLISQGDNAITKNAQVTADWIGRLLNGEVELIELTGGEDLNNFRTPGRYILRLASTAGPILNLPPWITAQNVFYLRVIAHTIGAFEYVMQDFSGLSDGSAGISSGYYRRNTSGASGALWIPWRRLDNDVAVANGGAGNANRLRVQEFIDAMGPVTTNGLGAIGLRFDHGLANLNAKLRAALEARGLLYCVALSSRGWNVPENSGVTPSMVDSWVGCEVWNHGAGPNHNDASDLQTLTDQIVKGKEELQAQLPNKKIWGFIPPGVGGTNYGGFNGGPSPEAFYGTLAGQLILENHAVSAGAFPGTAYRPLDGTVRQGMAHAGLETRTVASAKSIIDTAIANKTGLQLMTHPSRLDEPGYHTTAQVIEILDYIVAKRDAGELAVLSPYQMMVADSSQKVIVKETAGRTVSVWDYLNQREQLIYGDSGERDISALLAGAAGRVTVSREGPMVHLSLEGVAPSTSNSGLILTLPPGFRPATRKDFTMPATTAAAAWRSTYIFTSGGLGIWSPSTADNYRFYISFRTSEPWPTSLPGVAV